MGRFAVAFAHPLDEASPAAVLRSVDQTAVGLDDDAMAYRRLMSPVVEATRAPEGQGRHVAWAYCNVPHRSAVDMLPMIDDQIERFAPFRERVLARHTMTPADPERRNPNFVGGDIASGVMDLSQFVIRPTLAPISTPIPGVYVCSASTPPGVGVHRMCGCFAARCALTAVFPL